MPVLVLLLVFLMTSRREHEIQRAGDAAHDDLFCGGDSLFHGELAHTRPSPKHLTSFYLIMSLGGMLGGLFNALFAPIVFTFTSEYPITIVMACCLLPNMFEEKSKSPSSWTLILDVLLPVAMFCGCRMLQVNAQAISDYVYSYGGQMVMGLIGYTAMALPFTFLFETNTRFRIVLAIYLAVSLVLYAAVGPTIGYFSDSEWPAEIGRWIALAIAAVSYCIYWKRSANKS